MKTEDQLGRFTVVQEKVGHGSGYLGEERGVLRLQVCFSSKVARTCF